MRSRTIVFVWVWLWLSTLLLTTASFAGGKGKAQNFRLEAELDALLLVPETAVEAESDYRKQIHKGQVKQERFELKVKVPTSSPALGITDLATAENADIRVFLSDETGIYAVCFLEFIEIDDEVEEGEAVFKVDVRRDLRKGGSYRIHEVHGSCDLTPLTPDVDHQVPTIEAGHVATVAIINGITQTDFLEGVFHND